MAGSRQTPLCTSRTLPGLTGESGVPPIVGTVIRLGKAPVDIGAGDIGWNVEVVVPGLSDGAGVGIAFGAVTAPGKKTPVDVSVGAVGLTDESHAAAKIQNPITSTTLLCCMPGVRATPIPAPRLCLYSVPHGLSITNRHDPSG